MSLVDSSLIAFAGLALLIAITPGPDMATVTRAGLAYGRRGVILTSLGIATALLGWVSATAFGVAALLAASAVAFTVVKLVGAAYLAYLGVRTLWESRHDHGVEASAPLAPGSHIYRTGFLSAALNPKLGAFFVTLLPQFVEPGQPVVARIYVLGAIFIVIGLSWVMTYGLLVTRLRDVITAPRVRRWMERASGMVLVGLAARLAVEKA